MNNPYEPILKEVANGMLETAEIYQEFSNDSLLDAMLIFQGVFAPKIHELMEKERMPIKQRGEMAESFGNELRKLVKTYSGLDTVELVNNYGKI